MKNTGMNTKKTAALLACLAALSAAVCAGCNGSANSAGSDGSANSVGSAGAVSSAAQSDEAGEPSAADSAAASQESPADASAPQSGGTGEAGEPSAAEASGLWAGAEFTEDTWIGEGELTVLIEVKIEDKSVTFTVKSDNDNLAEILTGNGLAEGEDSAYGLYIKKVNGVRADYDLDKAYWALSKDGEAAMTGASDITIKDGEHYELVYTPA